jgi:hypothetical protein
MQREILPNYHGFEASRESKNGFDAHNRAQADARRGLLSNTSRTLFRRVRG